MSVLIGEYFLNFSSRGTLMVAPCKQHMFIVVVVDVVIDDSQSCSVMGQFNIHYDI